MVMESKIKLPQNPSLPIPKSDWDLMIAAFNGLLDTPVYKVSPIKDFFGWKAPTYRQLIPKWRGHEYRNRSALAKALEPKVIAYTEGEGFFSDVRRVFQRIANPAITPQVVWYTHYKCEKAIEVITPYAAALNDQKSKPKGERQAVVVTRAVTNAINTYEKFQASKWLPQTWTWQHTLGRLKNRFLEWVPAALRPKPTVPVPAITQFLTWFGKPRNNSVAARPAAQSIGKQSTPIQASSEQKIEVKTEIKSATTYALVPTASPQTPQARPEPSSQPQQISNSVASSPAVVRTSNRTLDDTESELVATILGYLGLKIDFKADAKEVVVDVAEIRKARQRSLLQFHPDKLDDKNEVQKLAKDWFTACFVDRVLPYTNELANYTDKPLSYQSLILSVDGIVKSKYIIAKEQRDEDVKFADEIQHASGNVNISSVEDQNIVNGLTIKLNARIKKSSEARVDFEKSSPNSRHLYTEAELKEKRTKEISELTELMSQLKKQVGKQLAESKAEVQCLKEIMAELVRQKAIDNQSSGLQALNSPVATMNPQKLEIQPELLSQPSRSADVTPTSDSDQVSINSGSTSPKSLTPSGSQTPESVRSESPASPLSTTPTPPTVSPPRSPVLVAKAMDEFGFLSSSGASTPPLVKNDKHELTLASAISAPNLVSLANDQEPLMKVPDASSIPTPSL